MKFIALAFLALFISTASLQAQHTVGSILWDPINSFSGYNLFYPNGGRTVYLTNDCGELVHTWTDSSFGSGNVAKLDSNGFLWVAKSGGFASNPALFAGGATDRIEKRDWDNNLLWHYTLNNSTARLHHDFILMPNGNVMVTAFERFSAAQMAAEGRDTSLNAGGELWPDMLLELQPLGADSAAIVWEWHAIDHVVQDFDSTKPNFGAVASSPQLIDLNLLGTLANADWMHANSIDYNYERNQILICVPNLSELWVIDHSTTTAEAAGHTGGLGARGGDLLFRWGNPMNHRQGSAANKKLGFQHDAHWVLAGMHPNDQMRGAITLFNNRYASNRSIAAIVDPVFDSYDWFYPMTGPVWGPADFAWTWCLPDSAQMYSPILSSAQRLPNQNMLIMAGVSGHAWEIDPSETLVSEYQIPLDNGVGIAQGDTVPPMANATFRMLRYSPAHPAFTGRDLSPIGWIETNADSNWCESILSAGRPQPGAVQVFPNPVRDEFTLIATAGSFIEIMNMQGAMIFSQQMSEPEMELNAARWPAGVYVLRVNGMSAGKIVRLHE